MGRDARNGKKEAHISRHQLTYFFTRMILALGRGVSWFVRMIGLGIRPLKPIVRFFASNFYRWILLPLYALYVMIRIRLSRVATSARGTLFLLFTNRYLFHITLVLISIVTILSQLTPRTATAFETSQNSLLYTLATQGRDELVEEHASTNTQPPSAQYLDPSTLQANGGIDFDAQPEEVKTLSTSIPGSLAVGSGTIFQTPDISGSVTSTNAGQLADNQPSTAPEPNAPATPKPQTYTIHSGDTLSGIAKQFGVTTQTILSANPGVSEQRLKLGATLDIPSTSGATHHVASGETLESIARAYGVSIADIADANQLDVQSTLHIGQTLTVPGATNVPAPVAVAAEPPATQPVEIAQAPIVTTEPASNVPSQDDTQGAEPDVSTNQPPTGSAGNVEVPPSSVPQPPNATNTEVPSGKLLWPTVEHTINQYYGWRHTGVDIDGDYTTPIYAADDGVVEKAGWNNGGYGLMILINHEDGMETRYGHASKLLVNVGDHVKRGQVIAMVGTTGRSTGTHLHFEVYTNGVRRNPLGYIQQ